LNYSDFTEINEDYVTGKVYGSCVVLGWSGKQHGKKLYVLQCNVCKEDPELFGDGLFISGKSNLDKGQISCGCSTKPLWTKEQLEVRLKREAESRGYIFHKLCDTYEKATTKIVVECKSHGIWDTMQANNFLRGQDCPSCSAISRSKNLVHHNTFEDEVFIERFKNSKLFPEGTTFVRNSLGFKDRYLEPCWDVTCPVCQITFAARGAALYKGSMRCDCRCLPKQAYINIIQDKEEIVAVKFGIARNPSDRKYRGFNYEYYLYGCWEFSNYADCLKAELVCKQTLSCGILDKKQMPDGYTETTYPNNIEKVISIFEEYGGQRIGEYL